MMNLLKPGFSQRRYFIALLTLMACPGFVLASDAVDKLLAQSEPPHGIVFEIVEADENALEDLLPRVRAAIERVRARFPDTEFAVVSHGREEFALQTQYQGEHAEIHQQVQSLVADDVPVHVCETHAGWYGVSAEDFPDYVNVAPTGPGQVHLYQELGYELIVVD
ncbi:MAG: DsrE family protein [Gammaproteobacteria bacterium]|nr:DsrE family protein [Gammaproteobacteria bacterium]MDH3858382.1 DsrE family protein [Gammaproteobacteria bacterium]